MEDASPGPAAPVAPAVVAVVVAHDPGEWFEQSLVTLAEQDYPNLSILVVDAGSATPVKARVGAVAPAAYVRRLDENPGFGAAANEVLDVVEGAAFYLFCHDDVALAPDAVRVLVEEAFRSNAGIVGPKLVQWDDPRRLLQVGQSVDGAGYVVALADRGELDQQQHDNVRDVFFVPGAVTLIRADLFAEVGGFDEGIDFLLDDLSLCWRAQLAGARVVVAPDARARHLEALGERRPTDDRRRLQSRHRLRVVLACASAFTLVRLVPRLVVLNGFEVLYALVVGRTRQARDVAGAWLWNLRRLPELRAARAQVKSFRRVPDSELRRTMVRGSARLSQFVRGQIGRGDDRLSGLARGGRNVRQALRGEGVGAAAAAWGVVLLVLVAGSRHLVTRGVPAVNELAPFTDGPLDLLRDWVSGWRTAGLGSTDPNPTGLGLLGGAGFLAFGSMGLLRTLLTVGLVPLGALGVYRLAGPVGSRRAQIVALVAYVANPLPYNSLANGRWGALVAYAVTPTLVSVLARAGGAAPFGSRAGSPGPGVRRRRWRDRVLLLGLLSALATAVSPAAVLLPVVLAVALALGGLIALAPTGGARMLAAGLLGSVVAFLLHLPWSIELVLPGTPLDGVTRGEAGLSAAELLRFETGPLGAAPVGWLLPAAAALALLLGKHERHAWAVRGWCLALVGWGLAWVAENAELAVGLPAAEMLLVPGAVGLALALAEGVAAFSTDLPGYRFGWRQVVSGLSALAVVVACTPVLGAAFDGQWSMPGGDHHRALRFIDDENDELSFRVLWLGDPDALPLGGWELDAGTAYATTDHGTPRVQDLWPGTGAGATHLLADAVQLAADRQTARLGTFLAPMAVRYVVVPQRIAPAPFATEPVPTPRDLVGVLAQQLDLERVDAPAGVAVFRNTSFVPTRAVLPGEESVPTSGGLTAVGGLAIEAASAALGDRTGTARWTGPVAAESTVVLSASSASGWELRVDGRQAPRVEAYGWANAFPVADGGEATLAFRTPIWRYGLLAIQVLAWLVVVRILIRDRDRALRGAQP